MIGNIFAILGILTLFFIIYSLAKELLEDAMIIIFQSTVTFLWGFWLIWSFTKVVSWFI